jgi:hypothetical protein
MPKNNSKKRQEQRVARALVRQTQATLRECGHFHTDIGFANCRYMEEK